MKVFVNWSGGPSYAVAKAPKDWRPIVIEAVDVFPVAAGTGPVPATGKGA